MADAVLIRTLEESGLARPAYAVLLTAFLVGDFGWTAAQFNALDRKIDAHSERLARIETLLSERLPAPQ